MNEFYMKSVIKDREREVSKYVEKNKIYNYYRDSAGNQPESNGKGRSVLIFWFLVVAKRLKGFFTIGTEDSVKALKSTTK